MNEVIELIQSKILDYSGINLAVSQQQPLLSQLEKKAAERGMLAIDYCHSLAPYTSDFDEIINLITVNETYFSARSFSLIF